MTKRKLSPQERAWVTRRDNERKRLLFERAKKAWATRRANERRRSRR